MKREHPELTIPTAPVEALVVKETSRYFNYLGLHYNVVVRDPVARDTLLARALREKLGRTVDRIYYLLAMIYPWKDIAAARWTLEHASGRARAGALEYLDNLLTGQMRKRVIPVLDDVPLEEKVRRGNLLLKSRVRDVEDSLAQLVHDADQIVAATAIHFVESRGVWALADDLEYALEHRDAKDWYVFEAASWALAAQRMAVDERRTRWMEPLPAVELADRLRRMALFDYVSVDELFRFADAGRQVRHEHGRVLYTQGATPDDLQFLLDGAVQRERRRSRPGVACRAAGAGGAGVRRSHGRGAISRHDHGHGPRHLPGAAQRAGARPARRERRPRAGPLPHGHRARERRSVAWRRSRRRPITRRSRGARRACSRSRRSC